MCARIVDSVIYLLFNSVVPATAEIGDGTVFAYRGIGVVLHRDSRLGSGCVIGQGVTIGSREGYVTTSETRCPTIGDNVYLAAGCRVLGGITIGENTIIGANAVVVRDVPSGSIVAGAPAKIVGATEPGYLAQRR